MRFVDWFAGIGGFRLGLERAGHKCVGSCEIDKNARAIYEKNFGEEPTERDIREVRTDRLPDADLWCGGFPCQGLSVAGKRGGIEGDERSGLWWEWMRLVEQVRPSWLLIENVPGLLSCGKGSDFGLVLASLEYLGYRVCWAVLNAQFFGVPQRRRRVFIVGNTGGVCPGEIFSEFSRRKGYSAKGKEARAEVAYAFNCRTGGVSAKEQQETLVVTGTLSCCDPKDGGPGDRIPIVADTWRPGNEAKQGSRGENLICSAADSDRMREVAGVPGRFHLSMCDCADSPRYRALGNGVAVPVIEWIGRRLRQIENGPERKRT